MTADPNTAPLRTPSHMAGVDVVRRLRVSVTGPTIHDCYYRQDARDAADEIERLRTALRELADSVLEDIALDGVSIGTEMLARSAKEEIALHAIV